MPSLWTPGGEVPVGREREQPGDTAPPPTAEPRGDGAPEPDEAQVAAELERYLLEARAEQVVLQHAAGLYELAALHLSQPQPRLADARLAIDALRGLVESVGDRLGEGGRQLRDLLPQLQMAFVQIADRSRPAPDTGSDGTAG